jgi:hypothetical protein
MVMMTCAPMTLTGVTWFYFMNTFTVKTGEAWEHPTKPAGARWRFDALKALPDNGFKIVKIVLALTNNRQVS